jgi:hypothetical protein
MLEPVTLNQTRFNAPGIAADSRGVALGKQGAVLFVSFDALVNWFRVLADEVGLDDLLPSLAVSEVRTPLDSLSYLVTFHADSSYLLDRAARLAALLGGATFTGSGKHFVKYRDPAAPLGYDIDAAFTEPADVVVYGQSFTQPLRRARALSFDQLIFRLSPRRALVGPAGRPDDGAPLWLAVSPGLAPALLSYLSHNRVPCAATGVEPEGADSAFAERRPAAARYLLLRVARLPERIRALCAALPGVTVYRAVTDNVAIEDGYSHPINLAACKSVFRADRFYLFAGAARPGRAVDVVALPPEGGGLPLVDGEKLVSLGFDLGAPEAPALPVSRASAPPPIAVTLRLVPSVRAPRRVTGAWLGWEHSAALQRLVFALPPTLLSGCRVAALVDGLLVLAAGSLDVIPLGEPLCELAPSVLAPLGHELIPRLDPALLADRVGGTAGRVVVFRRGAEAPIAVEEGLFEPLGRRMVGRLEVEPRSRAERSAPPVPERATTVHNDSAGLFPLWGYRER